MLTVTADQRQALHQRGLNDAIIDYCRIHTIDVAAATSLGVPPERRSNGPFLAAPGHDGVDWRTEGHPVYDKNLRLANDCPLPYWSPLVDPAKWDDPTGPLIICHDIFEANALAYQGLAALTHGMAQPCEMLVAKVAGGRRVIVLDDDGSGDVNAVVLRALATHRLCTALRALGAAVDTFKVSVAAWNDPATLATTVVAEAKPWLPAYEMLKAAIDTKDERAPFQTIESPRFCAWMLDASEAKRDEVFALAKKAKVTRKAITKAVEGFQKQVTIAQGAERARKDGEGGEQVRATDGGVYTARNGRLYYKPAQETEDHIPKSEPIALFDLRIQHEITFDDGFNVRHAFEVTAKARPKDTLYTLPPIQVPSLEFADLRWTLKEWGNACPLPADRNTFGQIREAAQLFSAPTRKTVYEHTGWVTLDDGEPVFLHRGGAIGAEDINVSFRGGEEYVLPTSASDDEIREAFKLSLALLECGSINVMVPLLAAVGLAPLREFCDIDFALWLTGPSGFMKTTRAKLVQRFYRRSDVNLIQWSSTTNALEMATGLLSGVIAIIDDFRHNNRNEKKEMEAKADRIIRSIGNQGGRGRMSRAGGLQATYFPKAMVVMTGEQLPRGESLQARLFVVRVDDGRNFKPAITAAQDQQAKYPFATYGYIDWIRQNYAMLAEEIPQQIAELMANGPGNGHARFSSNAAKLFVGYDTWFRCAHAYGVIDYDHWVRIRTEGFTAIQENIDHEIMEHAEESTYAQFAEWIEKLLDMHIGILASAPMSIDMAPRPILGFRVPEGLAIKPAAVLEFINRQSGGDFTHSFEAVRGACELNGWVTRNSQKGSLRVRFGGEQHRVWIIPEHIASELGLLDRVHDALVVTPFTSP